jgi:hypothetical protein
MSPVRLRMKRWATAAKRMVAMIVIAWQSLGASWIPEPVQPRLDEEFAKQEKIYQRQGPGSYTTNRGLSSYAELLPSGFCDALAKLGSAQRWLDIGAGQGQAILDYYATAHNAASGDHCVGSGVKGRAVAISIEDRRTEKWKQQAASLGDERIRYLSGKRLSQYSVEELGTFRIITDVFGGFTYTDNLSRFVASALNLLDVGGAFYTVLSSVHLEDGRNKLGTWYRTELVDATSRPITVCSWLKRTTCAKVTCESKSNWAEPSELITIQKVCSETSVPRTNVIEYMAGSPPGRRFQLEP